ncbi:YkgJ family cysteine cluster protein [Rubinisphaera margarita]|uniref:YkgJ family cysteine cluster protein n=1 Tax=Rubinisphaera margarita TaxID=2909586 RepID=UPI001EE803CF|nr:YkgJ family cysteine cluster protein [Rubinisphaera margarita]MCG6155500.1 YkgJ family cysteine cluster protein [Rubinisphaera margarita]
MTATKRVTRADLKPGEFLCDHCTAKCCRYFALPIDTPDSREELENIRWYLLHEDVSIFVDEGTWFLMVHTVCRKLRSDNLCGIYETRPQICRDYSTDNCEYDGDGCYDQLFESPEQMWEYIEAVYPQKKPKRKPARTELPIVS